MKNLFSKFVFSYKKRMLLVYLLSWLGFLPHAQALNTNYYLDCSSSSNGNGSSSSPWNKLSTVNNKTFGAGDQLRIKRDTSCSGQLAPKGSGAVGNPIIIRAYGSGSKPIIAANGDYAAALYLYNQEYIEVKNLEITNSGNGPTKRYGVLVELKDVGVANYYRFTNLKVHDVDGSNEHKDNGGIIFSILQGTVPTKFNDVILDGNNVYSVDRTGIYIGSYWNDRDELHDGGGEWLGSTNFIFRNNTVADVGGDGLVPHYTTGALAEYNVVHDFNMRSTGANVGLWCWNCDQVTYQYNEIYHGGWDGNLHDSQAMDIDGGNIGNLYQYNYTHDNKGGMLLICGWEVSTDNVIRYNISQNDGDDVIHLACDNMTNTHIYNNVVYMDDPVQTPARVIHIDPSWLGANGKTVYFYNNIFYADTPDALYELPSNHKATFDSNLFYGLNPPSTINDPNKVIADPKLVNPGQGGSGLSSLSGYQLQSNSPAIGAGRIIADNGGADFWGNAVSTDCAPDIGAHQFSNNSSCNPSTAPEISNANWSLHYVDSEELVGENSPATNAFDGDESTIWHTQWKNGSPDHPHEIQINLGASYNLEGLRYLPRQGSQNGNVSGYEIYVSNDGSNWGSAVASGSFSSNQNEKEVLFSVTAGQYVRFKTLSEVNGNVWANAAEIKLLGRPATVDVISQSGWSLHYVDSEELVGENAPATNAFDGDSSSIWHTQWKNASPAHAHEIQINLGNSYTISALRYLPRQNTQNGRVGDYEIYVSADGSNWGAAVASGTFNSNANEKEVTFNATSGQYIRFVALSEVGGNAWTSVAELNVIGL